MKGERHALVVTCGSMSATSPSTTATYSPSQPPLPTPSPFSFSAASTRWSSRPPIVAANLILRLVALIFSFGSAISLAAPSPRNDSRPRSSFHDLDELLYCFMVNVMVFLYTIYQLSRGICEINRGVYISGRISDYVNFIFDQLAGYLLISSSSVAVPAIQQVKYSPTLWKAAIISICMSFASFLVIAACALLSGYKFCKRIMR